MTLKIRPSVVSGLVAVGLTLLVSLFAVDPYGAVGLLFLAGLGAVVVMVAILIIFRERGR